LARNANGWNADQHERSPRLERAGGDQFGLVLECHAGTVIAYRAVGAHRVLLVAVLALTPQLSAYATSDVAVHLPAVATQPSLAVASRSQLRNVRTILTKLSPGNAGGGRILEFSGTHQTFRTLPSRTVHARLTLGRPFGADVVGGTQIAIGARIVFTVLTRAREFQATLLAVVRIFAATDAITAAGRIVLAALTYHAQKVAFDALSRHASEVQFAFVTVHRAGTSHVRCFAAYAAPRVIRDRRAVLGALRADVGSTLIGE